MTLGVRRAGLFAGLALLLAVPALAGDEPGGDAPKSEDEEPGEEAPRSEGEQPGDDAPRSDEPKTDTEIIEVQSIDSPEPQPPAAPAPVVPGLPEPQEVPSPMVPESPELQDAPAADAPAEVGEGEAPADAEQDKDKKQDKPAEFVKGELLDVGQLDLLGERSRAGARVGYRAIGSIHYGTVEPGADLRISKFRLGLSVPLNIEIWDGSEGLVSIDATTGKKPKPEIHGFDNAGKIRSEDWDHWRDYFRVLRYAGWGRKEDKFHVNVSQSKAGSIGHGLIMKRYLPQVDLDTVRIGAQLDAYLDWLGGFEFYTNDLTRWNMIGVLAFVKPLGPFFDDYLSRSLSIGFSFVTDRDAPLQVATETITSNIIGAYPWYVVSLDDKADETLPRARRSTGVYIWGIDTELKVMKTKTTDIKVYVDFSKMADAGFGFAGGSLFRLNFGDETVNAFRIRVEGRYFTGNYQPSYFDSFYEIDKWQYLTGKNSYPPLTKYEAIAGAPADGHFGYFLEFGYSMVGAVSIGGTLEGQTPDETYNLMLSLSVPWLDRLRVAATYQKRHFASFGDIFSFQDNDWLTALIRVKIFPVLFISGQAGYLWRLNRNKIGSGVDKGLPGSNYGLYQGHWDLRAWIDVAYEFEI